MEPSYELDVLPADELEQAAFEGALHEFVASESRKPEAESSSVFARYDAPTGRWVLTFDTSAALKAFRDHWLARIRRLDRPSPASSLRGAGA
jgi:hypothetical protein